MVSQISTFILVAFVAAAYGLPSNSAVRTPGTTDYSVATPANTTATPTTTTTAYPSGTTTTTATTGYTSTGTPGDYGSGVNTDDQYGPSYDDGQGTQDCDQTEDVETVVEEEVPEPEEDCDQTDTSVDTVVEDAPAPEEDCDQTKDVETVVEEEMPAPPSPPQDDYSQTDTSVDTVVEEQPQNDDCDEGTSPVRHTRPQSPPHRRRRPAYHGRKCVRHHRRPHGTDTRRQHRPRLPPPPPPKTPEDSTYSSQPSYTGDNKDCEEKRLVRRANNDYEDPYGEDQYDGADPSDYADDGYNFDNYVDDQSYGYGNEDDCDEDCGDDYGDDYGNEDAGNDYGTDYGNDYGVENSTESKGNNYGGNDQSNSTTTAYDTGSKGNDKAYGGKSHAKKQKSSPKAQREHTYSVKAHDKNTDMHKFKVKGRNSMFKDVSRHADERDFQKNGKDYKAVDKYGQKVASRHEDVKASQNTADMNRTVYRGPNGTYRHTDRSGSQNKYASNLDQRTFDGPNRQAFEKSYHTSESSRQYSDSTTVIKNNGNKY